MAIQKTRDFIYLLKFCKDLHSASWPLFYYVARNDLELSEAPALHLLSTGIVGVCHYTQLRRVILTPRISEWDLSPPPRQYTNTIWNRQRPAGTLMGIWVPTGSLHRRGCLEFSGTQQSRGASF